MTMIPAEDAALVKAQTLMWDEFSKRMGVSDTALKPAAAVRVPEDMDAGREERNARNLSRTKVNAVMIRRRWDIQIHWHSWPLQLGFHFDHTDPSITFHLPFAILAIGKLKQPGFRTPSSPN